MVYNESFNLPLWEKHYNTQCPGCELIVIDHGSDVPVREVLGSVSVLRLQRSDFDERRRAEFASRLHGTLLLEYDWVFYTDCDELIVSKSHERLSDALADEADDTVALHAVGLNLWHYIDGEPEFDRSKHMGTQRKFASFEKSMCKPFAARTPTSWIPGFHNSTNKPCFGDGYYLVHTKYMDFNEAMGRLSLTSSLTWSAEALEKGWSSHQRVGADVLEKRYKSIASFITKQQVDPFDFSDECSEYIEQSVLDKKGNWRSDAKLRPKIVEIPSDVLHRLP